MSRLVAFGFALLLTMTSVRAWAFPDMIRHNYVNCTSCHFSTTGGGLLTDYGRQTSKAALSYGKFFFENAAESPAEQAKKKGEDVQQMDENDPEPKFLYGSVNQPDWLRLGGDLRFLQFFENTPAFNMGQFYTMQMDLEAAVTVGKFTVVATGGRQDATVASPSVWDYFVSHQHYVNFQATDQLVFTGGKYGKPYGVNIPNHFRMIRSVLGWDISLDTFDSYNVQAAYLGDNLNVYAAYDFGRPDNVLVLEHGPVLTVSEAFADKYKVGASYFYGMTDALNRHVFGPWAELGFTEHFYLETEQDFVEQLPQVGNAPSTFGYVDYLKLADELVQGFQVFATQEYAQLNLKDSSTRQQAYGVGLSYFPRPHWEFEGVYEKKKDAQFASFYDVAWILLHYYL